MDDGITFTSEDNQKKPSQVDDVSLPREEIDAKIDRAFAGLAVGKASAHAEAVPSGQHRGARGHRQPREPSPTTTSHDETKFVYNMKHRNRGMAVIISNQHFKPSVGMGDRTGSQKDADDLARVFRLLDFDVRIHKDLTIRDMKITMQRSANVDHTDNDCFACVILSHGEGDEVYGIDGNISIDVLVAPFKGQVCRSLAGKPKLFFFQACRGSLLDAGVEVTDSTPERESIPELTPRIPTEADFLMCYSVTAGYFSFRNVERGSWFIQALCYALEKYGSTLDILRIMTRVCHNVAYDYESNAKNPLVTKKKQVPSIVSMLTKELYFSPKNRAVESSTSV